MTDQKTVPSFCVAWLAYEPSEETNLNEYERGNWRNYYPRLSLDAACSRVRAWSERGAYMEIQNEQTGAFVRVTDEAAFLSAIHQKRV